MYLCSCIHKKQKFYCLIGLAIWESKESWLAARPAMIEAVKDDSFDDWWLKPPEVYHLVKV
ncbi:MAG TPA: hypothetical protein VMV43_06295 [Candidatus Nanopelagicaceae bacterium]|nr:hypothetical protein [Candidatus Nanopelagicaceae bacterium]